MVYGVTNVVCLQKDFHVVYVFYDVHGKYVDRKSCDDDDDGTEYLDVIQFINRLSENQNIDLLVEDPIDRLQDMIDDDDNPEPLTLVRMYANPNICPLNTTCIKADPRYALEFDSGSLLDLSAEYMDNRRHMYRNMDSAQDDYKVSMMKQKLIFKDIMDILNSTLERLFAKTTSRPITHDLFTNLFSELEKKPHVSTILSNMIARIGLKFTSIVDSMQALILRLNKDPMLHHKSERGHEEVLQQYSNTGIVPEELLHIDSGVQYAVTVIGELVDIYVLAKLLLRNDELAIVYFGAEHAKKIVQTMEETLGYTVLAASKDLNYPQWSDLNDDDLFCTNLSCIPSIDEVFLEM